MADFRPQPQPPDEEWCPEHDLWYQGPDCPECRREQDSTWDLPWDPDDRVGLGPAWEPDQGLGLDLAGEQLPAWMWHRSDN